MQVIPVIDLLGEHVVRGIGGRRDEYRPIESRLCGDARPQSVGQAFAQAGFKRVYVADLDAIQTVGNGWQPAWSTYDELARLGLELWIDAGLGNATQARALADGATGGAPIAGIVVGLETLGGPGALVEIVRVVGPERLVFSLDLKAGVPLAGRGWKGLSAESIAVLALRAGVRRLIVLDLANVGTGGGTSTIGLCRTLASLEPRLQIVAGGGVRGTDDLNVLERAGCTAALVASALHDGRLAATDCAARS